MCLPLRRKLQSIINSVPAVMAIISLIFLWHYLSVNNVVPSYMLPKPMDVFNVLIEEKDILFEHALITLQEAFWGLGIGIGLGFVIATIMDEIFFIKQFIRLWLSHKLFQLLPLRRCWYFGWDLEWNLR